MLCDNVLRGSHQDSWMEMMAGLWVWAQILRLSILSCMEWAFQCRIRRGIEERWLLAFGRLGLLLILVVISFYCLLLCFFGVMLFLLFLLLFCPFFRSVFSVGRVLLSFSRVVESLG